MYYNLRDYDMDLSFSSWIYRITRNEAISQFRKRKARPHGNSVDVEDYVIEAFTAEFDLNKEVDEEYLREHIGTLIDKMDLKYREVLVLKYWQDRSYEEMSDILQKPPGTVATLLSRAKQQFRKLYKEL